MWSLNLAYFFIIQIALLISIIKFNICVIFFISIAPGTYDVEKADKRIHESSPSYSLGVKPKEPKHEDIPGKLLNCHSLHNTVVNDVVDLFTI